MIKFQKRRIWVMFWLPLIISILFALLTYTTARSSPNSMYNKELPEKYLIRNPKLKRYFFNPTDELTKHFVYCHFIYVFAVVLNLLLYILYFYNGSTAIILDSENYIKLFGLCIICVELIVYAIDSAIYINIFKNKKW